MGVNGASLLLLPVVKCAKAAGPAATRGKSAASVTSVLCVRLRRACTVDRSAAGVTVSEWLAVAEEGERSAVACKRSGASRMRVTDFGLGLLRVLRAVVMAALRWASVGFVR